MVEEVSLWRLKKRGKRRLAEATGRDAEIIAADWYIKNGFVILAHRWRQSVGEIDLIAATESLLTFVEVKARSDFSLAAEAVTLRQRRRIVNTAELALSDHPEWRRSDIRFDVILVVAEIIVPIIDAFRADDTA